MSVINQMLKDLDERQAEVGLGSASMPIRSLPGRSAMAIGRWWWGLGLAMVVVGGGAWYYLEQAEHGRGAVSAAVPPVSLPAAGDVVPSTVVAVPSEALPPSPIGAPLRLSAELATLPSPPTDLPKAVPANRELPALAATQPKLIEAAKPVEVPSPSKPATAPTAVAASAAPPYIDKQVRLSTPREKGDYEYRRGLAAFNQGRLSEAQELLLVALREDPGHLSARQLLLKLLVEQRSLEEAKRLLLEGLALHPSQTGWAMALARMQMDGGDLRSAVQTLEGSRAFGKDSADYCGLFGALLQRMQRYKDAAEQYRGALRQAPADARWWIGLGVALEADGAVVEARQAYQNARSAGGLTADLASFVEQKLR